jgi:hypothetical protein
MQAQLDAYSKAYTKLMDNGFVYVFSIQSYGENFKIILTQENHTFDINRYASLQPHPLSRGNEWRRQAIVNACSPLYTSIEECTRTIKEFVQAQSLELIREKQELLSNEIKRVKEIMREHRLANNSF